MSHSSFASPSHLQWSSQRQTQPLASPRAAPTTMQGQDHPPSSPDPLPPRGLDALLYNVYTKTIAVITASRLTHWQDLEAFQAQEDDLDTLRANVLGSPEWDQGLPHSPLPNTPTTSDKADQSGGSSAAIRKMNRWFGLLLPELDLFKEETSLWRRLSAFVPPSALEASIETPATDQRAGAGRLLVPPMILDVIFDPSQLAADNRLVLVGSQPHRGSQHFIPPTKAPGPSELFLHRPIVLERWRIDFNVFSPDAPPDLRAIYQKCITHFRLLYSLTRSLPTQRLYRDLKRTRLEVAKRNRHVPNQNRTLPADSLQIGCRLGAGEPDEEDELQELGLKAKLVDANMDSRHKSLLGDSGDVEPSPETNIKGFGPLITPFGSLNVSVEYRLDVDFRVDTSTSDPPLGIARPVTLAGVTVGVDSIDLRPEEDYFRPKGHPSRRQSLTSVRSTGFSSLHSADDPPKAMQVTPQTIPTSSSSGSTDHPIRSSSSASNPSPSSSLFSQSVPSRPRLPPAGLSSLRHQSSAAAMANVNLPPTFDTGSVGSVATSSALAAALGRSPSAGEPAFLTNSARRTSMGERKFRTLSNAGAFERASPPSPSAGASFPSSMRQAIPHQMRFGSYSPSSSSPLAQRLSASQSQRQLQSSQGYHRASSYSISPNTGAGTLAANSTSMSGLRSVNAGISLRSVFQDYVPRSLHRGEATTLTAGRQSAINSTVSASRPSLRRQTSGGSEEQRSFSLSGTVSGSMGADNTTGTTSTAPQAARVPSVAPQMIQRYARTPSYRQERRTVSTSIDESSAEGTGEPARGASSGDSNQSSIYSRSWQARTEARQAMIVNAMQRGSLGAVISGSPGSLLARDFATPSPVMSSAHRSPSSTSASSLPVAKRRGSLYDLVDMIESRTQTTLRPTRLAQVQGNRPPQMPTPSASSTKSLVGVIGDHASPGESFDELPGSVCSGGSRSIEQRPPSAQLHAFDRNSARGPGSRSISSSPMYLSTAIGSGSGSNSGVVLSRSTVDEMLAKMSMSVNHLTGPTSRHGGLDAITLASTGLPVSLSSNRPRSERVEQHVEGGYGAISNARQIGDPRRQSTIRGPGPPSPASTRRLTRLTASRSQSSFELYSPESPARHLHSSGDRPSVARSSSSYEEGTAGGPGGADHPSSFDAIGLVNFEEEEPAGRLELHSEPGTPHYSFARSYTTGIVSQSPRSGSTGPTSAHGGVTATRGLEMEGGLGGLAGPTDAERLKTFGEDLGSTRGKRNISPWTRNPRGVLHHHTAAAAAAGGGIPINSAIGGAGAGSGSSSASATRGGGGGNIGSSTAAGSANHPHFAEAYNATASSPPSAHVSTADNTYPRFDPSNHGSATTTTATGALSLMNFNNGSKTVNSGGDQERDREGEYRERRDRREASDQAWREYQRQRNLNLD